MRIAAFRANNIRLNTELVKKPKDLLEYVIVHDMAHLVESTPLIASTIREIGFVLTIPQALSAILGFSHLRAFPFGELRRRTPGPAAVFIDELEARQRDKS